MPTIIEVAALLARQLPSSDDLEDIEDYRFEDLKPAQQELYINAATKVAELFGVYDVEHVPGLDENGEEISTQLGNVNNDWEPEIDVMTLPEMINYWRKAPPDTFVENDPYAEYFIQKMYELSVEQPDVWKEFKDSNWKSVK